MIYADNASTTPISRKATDVMLHYMEAGYGNPSSLHTMGQRAAEALAQARENIAGHLGCKATEILFTSGGSEANNQALYSAAAIGKAEGRMHIISTAFEHHAILHPLDMLRREGFDVTLLKVPENGIVTAQQIAAAIRDDTCLVTVMYANNEIGTIQPIEEIGAICRSRGVLFHTDAVQALGHIPIHVAEQKIDLLSLSAHKFHGPKGIGALYVRSGIPLESLITGGRQEWGKRAGTENLPAIMGMAAALDDACTHMNHNGEKVSALRDRLIRGLAEIPCALLNGDRNRRLPGNVSFCFEGIDGEALVLLLDHQGVCASSGSACSAGTREPSHVLLSIGRTPEVARGALRLSLCEANTEDEVASMLRIIPRAVGRLRSLSPFWKDIQEEGKKHGI